MNSKFHGCEPTAWRKEGNQTITSFNTTFLCMLQRGPIVTRKGRQGGPGLTTVSVWQFDSLAAWMRNSYSLAAGLLDSFVARQLGCLTVWPYNSCSLTAWQRGLAASAACLLDSLAACRAGNPKNMQPSLDQASTRPLIICIYIYRYHSKGLDQRSGSTPLERSGSGVWIRGMDRLWDRGLIQTWHFEQQPYVYFVSFFLHFLRASGPCCRPR